MAILARTARELVGKTVQKAQTLLARWIDRVAEQQIRKARFETQMYGGAYKHSSKNDDDLPTAGQRRCR
jgi:hypothetical protein